MRKLDILTQKRDKQKKGVLDRLPGKQAQVDAFVNTVHVQKDTEVKIRCDPVVIPYVKGVSEQVRRVMKGYGLKVYFKAQSH